MAEPGDIMDELDDDGFRRSLEDADKDGQWKDPSARFEDPKLTQLARQLAAPPRANYTERRKQELARRAAAEPRRIEEAHTTFGGPPSTFVEPPPPPEPTPAPAPASNWRESVIRTDAVPPPPPAPAATAAPATETPGFQVLDWCRQLGSAAAVFAAGMAVQFALAGWAPWWGVRATLAAIATGIAWHFFGQGRFRAAAIGTGAHLIAFVSTGGATTSQELFGAFAGGMVVMLGSGGVGLMREEADSRN